MKVVKRRLPLLIGILILDKFLPDKIKNLLPFSEIKTLMKNDNDNDDDLQKLDIPEDLPFEVYSPSPRKEKQKIEVPRWILGTFALIQKYNGFTLIKDFIGDKFFKKDNYDQDDQKDGKLISSIIKEIEKLKRNKD